MATNAELAGLFTEISTLLRLRGEDAFRVRAYERAAAAISAAPKPLADLSAHDIAAIKGIGASTAKKIVEHRDTGQIAMLSDLRDAIPAGVVELLRVPGLGPKTAVALNAELGVDSIESLRGAITSGAINDLKGMGAKTAANLADALERMGAKDDDRLASADGLEIAKAVVATLEPLDGVEQVTWAGSLRRMRETVGDIDVLVATSDPAGAMAAFRGHGLVTEVLAAGDTKSSVLMAAPGRGDRRCQVDVRVVEPEAWGAALVYFTGSKDHNVRIRERAVRRGLKLNEYGLFRVEDDGADERIAATTEEDVYAALDLVWVPPPMREDRGEVDAAADASLPAVITEADLRGDLHGHSDFSGDGRVDLPGMLTAAAARGLDFWAVTDHAEDLRMNGVSRERILERRRLIGELGDSLGIRILDGAELNIDGDGGVDYDPDFLSEFDWCVASIHSLMGRDRDAQTDRIITAMRNPHVHAIGHPTGRKIGMRPGYELDWDRVVAVAVETGTALEINGSARRLDLSADLARQAVEAGVLLTISSDAHDTGDLDNLRWGVLTAQRAWITPQSVVSCWSADEVLEWAAAKADRVR